MLQPFYKMYRFITKRVVIIDYNSTIIFTDKSCITNLPLVRFDHVISFAGQISANTQEQISLRKLLNYIELGLFCSYRNMGNAANADCNTESILTPVIITVTFKVTVSYRLKYLLMLCKRINDRDHFPFVRSVRPRRTGSGRFNQV